MTEALNSSHFENFESMNAPCKQALHPLRRVGRLAAGALGRETE